MYSFNRTGLAIMSIVLVLIVACGNGEAEQPEQDVGGSSDTQNMPPNRLIRLVDPLDDPGHYCIDVRGFGSNARVQDSLQAHTCKPNDNRDQQFTYQWPIGRIKSEEFDLCMEPESLLLESARIFLQECSSISKQGFKYHDDGTIRPLLDLTNTLCIAVADGEGHVINSIHKRRELFVQTCESTDPSLMTWLFDIGASGQGS